MTGPHAANSSRKALPAGVECARWSYPVGDRVIGRNGRHPAATMAVSLLFGPTLIESDHHSASLFTEEYFGSIVALTAYDNA